MGQTLKTTFSTRRDAELAVEHLVQAHGIARTDIVIAPEGAANSAGEEASGPDLSAASPGEDARTDGALNGRIGISVDLKDDDLAATVQGVFREMGGSAR